MRGQPPARKLETRASASAKLEAQRTVLRDPVNAVAAAHSAYLLATGLWPLLHLRSFAKVTGPKPEGWLAKTVGACMANVGLTLARAVLRDGRNRRRLSPDLQSLALRTSVTLAAFDFFYGGIKRRISPAYLLNGAIELGFAGAWIAAMAWKKHARALPPAPAYA